MQKMTKISIIVLLCLLVGVAVVASVLTGGDDQRSKGSVDAMLQHVPADTPLFFVGQGTTETVAYSDAILRRTNPQDLQPIVDLLNTSDQDSGARLLSWLLADYTRVAATAGVSGLSEQYGLDLHGVYSFYIHGAAPVLRWSLSDAEALREHLAQAQAETGIAPRDVPLGGATLQVWPLADDSEIELALLIHDGFLTLSLIAPSDSEAARLQRFALQTGDETLDASPLWETLQEDYAQADVFSGFFDTHRIAEALLLPEQNSTGRELRQWFPDMNETVGADLADGCRRDYVHLASQMPRLSMGLHSTEVDAQELSQKLGFLWSIENQAALTALQKLHGFLPAYSRRSDDKIGAFALGANLSELVPVATELWTQFTSATFECDRLLQMQQRAQGFNPAMLAMMGAGMVDSIRGAGVALYDLNQEARTLEELAGSFLVSLSSEEPTTIAALASAYLPQLAGVTIPDDGSAVAVPNLAGMNDMQAAIKGKHLVVFRGDAAAQAADELAGEALEATGLASGAFNLRDGESLLNPGRNVVGSLGAGGCNEFYGSMLVLSQLSMEMTGQEQFSDRGWTGNMEVRMTVPEVLNRSDLAGTYLMESLDDYDCQWYPAGIEEFSAEGDGQFNRTDEAQACDVHQSEFTWTLTGSLIEQQTVAQRERFDCNAEWNETEQLDDFSCAVLLESDEGFYCLHQLGGEMELYRYRQQ